MAQIQPAREYEEHTYEIIMRDGHTRKINSTVDLEGFRKRLIEGSFYDKETNTLFVRENIIMIVRK